MAHSEATADPNLDFGGVSFRRDILGRGTNTETQLSREQIVAELSGTPEFLEGEGEFRDEADVQGELLRLAIDDLRQGGQATPEQIALIEQIGDAALARGLTDVERFETGAFRGLREELAPSLGLRPGDTPILDRGGMIAAEGLRQRGNLAETARGGEAIARLNFPLAVSGQLQSGVQGQQGISLALQQFQEQLKQQAFQNRFNIFGTQAGLGSNLATGSSPLNVNAPRDVTTTTTGGGSTSTSGGFGLGEIGSLAGGLGSLGTLLFSSRELKTDKTPVDEDEVLDAIEALPIETWRYKPGLGLGDQTHIGTFAEDFREGLGLGDGQTLDMIDTTGALMASVKALSKKVKRLEGLGLAHA